MATLTTPIMGLPYPDDNELLQDVPDFIRVLALALDKSKIPSFATSAARNTAIPAPTTGSIAWVHDNNPMPRLTTFDGTNWVRVYPPVTVVLSGNGAPTGSAEAGSIYI